MGAEDREVGLSHNDLHANNLFVEVLPEPQTRLYIVSPQDAFLVETALNVRFFDWDRAHVDCGKANEVFENNLLRIDYAEFRATTDCENRVFDEHFCDSGYCNRPGAYRADLWKFLHEIQHRMRNPLSQDLLTTLRQLQLRHCSRTIAALDSGQLTPHGVHDVLALPLDVVMNDPEVRFYPAYGTMPKISYSQLLGVSKNALKTFRGTLTDKLAFPEEEVDQKNEIRAWMHPAKKWLLDDFFASFKVSVDDVEACREMTFSLPNARIDESMNRKLFKQCGHPLTR